MRNLLIFIALSSLCIFSCNSPAGNTSNTTTVASHTAAPKSKLEEANTLNMVGLLKIYYELKDAFVATSATKADAAANKLIKFTAGMQESLEKDPANGPALKPYLDTITTESKAMVAMMDESCEKKRLNFEKISGAMFGMLKIVELKNAGVYRQYCPMAFNEKGAYWLSNVSDIKNPYFGDKMLECGEVTDSLK